MYNKFYLFVVCVCILIFPFKIHASVLSYNGAFYPGCTSYNGQGPSSLCQKYAVDGDSASCLDANLCNPEIGLDNLEESILDVNSGGFAKGLIAITNYAILNSMSEVQLAHAYRIFAIQTGNSNTSSGGVLWPAKLQYIQTYNLAGPINDAVNIGKSALAGDESANRYLPITTSSSSSDISIVKIGQEEPIYNGNYMTVVANVNIVGDNPPRPSSCYADDFTCTIQFVSDNSFNVKLHGVKGNKTSVEVKIKFNGIVNSGSLVNEIKLYQCNGESCSNRSRCYTFGQTQRFIKLNQTSSTESDKSINISLPSICDDPNMSLKEKLEAGCCDSVDPSSLIEGSDEEEAYIDACGPIVVIENNCGADSCNDSSYKDYTHSYVRQKTMKSIMKELDNGNSGSLGDYLDYQVNEFCGAYVTESVDTLMPATAVSVSGQFFVFDKYNDLNCTTETSCLRQPYISGKVKSTFFTDYNKWKSAYQSAISNEESTYSSWQGAVSAVGPAYNSWNNCTSDCCYSHEETYGNETITVCDVYKVDLYNTWQSAISSERSAQSSYKAAVSKRINLQRAKDQCVQEDAAFRSNFAYDFSPKLSFIYSQTSKTNGTQQYTMDMVSNTSSVKYWPNTTTSSMSNVDYLGDNAAGLDRDTATNRRINNYRDTFNRGGSYLIDDRGTLGSYRFPDGSHDGCSGSGCTLYEYTNKSFTSIKTKSNDATDPYGKITNKDDISMIYFYRPDKNTFALMNSGEYKTLNYDSNEAITQMNGLEVGYVYNLELTAFKGQYTTNFKMENVGYKGSAGGGFTQKLIDEKVNEEGFESFNSVCNYCNYEMAFKRECPECDPDDPGDPGDFTAQFYYRSISLSDVNPNEKPEGETNWSDAKGLAAVNAIEAVSGNQIIGNVSDAGYLADASGSNLNKQNVPDLDYTYLADSSSYDIYDDESREFLEYEITLTPKDMQIIKKNSAKSNFDYAKMNMCGNSIPTNKDADNNYCFKCNKDMKECESSFVTAFFSDETDLNKTRTKKWKYYVNGLFCKGSINSCLGGSYPDPVFAKSYIAENKNWP